MTNSIKPKLDLNTIKYLRAYVEGYGLNEFISHTDDIIRETESKRNYCNMDYKSLLDYASWSQLELDRVTYLYSRLSEKEQRLKLHNDFNVMKSIAQPCFDFDLDELPILKSHFVTSRLTYIYL